jgi:DNA-directed RNA polymerase subunit RPC12/RpoP
MDDTIQIRCTRCNSSFRDRARRIQSGYARECPNCNVLIFFESESHDEHIKRALKAAHRMRRALTAAEGEKSSAKEAPKYNRTS